MIEVGLDRNLGTGVTTVRLRGDLTTRTTLPARRAIAKVAAECPAAVLVDIAALRVTEDAAASVFAAATHHAQESWGVPVLLCSAEPACRRKLVPFRNFVALYDTPAHALPAVRAYAPRWLREHLGPVPASARTARNLAGEACLTWNLVPLRDRARLVATELAANAIRHAGTEFDVLVSYTRVYLRIAVRDGSSTLPRPVDQPPVTSAVVPRGDGRGLWMIAGSATQWGCTTVPDGKIVWSLMRA